MMCLHQALYWAAHFEPTHFYLALLFTRIKDEVSRSEIDNKIMNAVQYSYFI